MTNRPWQLKLALIMLAAAALWKTFELYQLYGFSSPPIIIGFPLGVALTVVVFTGLWTGNPAFRALILLVSALKLLHLFLSAFSSGGLFRPTAANAAAASFCLAAILLLICGPVRAFFKSFADIVPHAPQDRS